MLKMTMKFSGRLEGETIYEKAVKMINNFASKGIAANREDKDDKVILHLSKNPDGIKTIIISKDEECK